MSQVKSMAINPIFTDTQLVKLVSTTPKQHIMVRQGRGGQRFKYATTSYVQKVLNEVFGWSWSFQIVDKGNDPQEIGVWVHGRLTIIDKESRQPIIIKEQFGSSDIKKDKSGKIVDYADDLKSASSDALKKCASLLGICADLYADPQTASEITQRADKVKAVLLEKLTKEQNVDDKPEKTE